MIYAGTDLKFAIDIQCEGFSMDENDFMVDLVNGKKRISLSKEDLAQDSDGWYLYFNSGELGAGDIYVIVYASGELFGNSGTGSFTLGSDV